MFRDQRGMTLIEISIAITIVAMLMGGLVGVVALMQKKIPTGSAQLAVENRHQSARYWITRDANSATTFTTGTTTTYGTFSWNDFTGGVATPTPTPTATPTPTPTPTPAPAVTVRTTQSDFEAAGTTRTNLDTVTIPGDMFLLKGTTPGTSFSTNAAQPAALGTGAHAFRRPNGLFLIFRGAAPPGVVVRTTQPDFEAAGTTRTNLDTATIPGDMFLLKGTTPGTSFSTNVAQAAALGTGANAIRRPNGLFLIFRGAASTANYDYDPVANTFTTRAVLSAAIGAGGFSFQRSNGTFVNVRAGATTGTLIYDPSTNGFVTGPALSGNAGAGALAIANTDGTFLIVHGNNLGTTTTYTPTGGTGGIGSTAAGPAVGVTVGAGAHAIRKPDGNYLLIAGNAAGNTRIYNPGTKAFSAGNATGANVGAGGHSIERPGNLFLVLTGGNTNVSRIYDATANTFAAGPTVLGAREVNDGAHAYQRADGKWMIIKADATSNTSIYDPVANTMAAGPALVTTYTTGAISLQRTNGKYLTLGPTGSTAGSLYDAGYFVSGQYVSEAISPAGIDSFTTIEWDQTADVTLAIFVRTATTQVGLSSATYRSIAASGGAIGAAAGEVWIQVRVDYSRAIPSYPLSNTEVWRGSASTFYIRTFAQPDIQEIRLNFTPTATDNYDYDPVANTFTARAALPAAIGVGGFSFQRSNGTFVTVRGNLTNGTLIYDPSTNGFVAGPALSGNAGAGATVIPNTDGTFLIVHGNNLGTTTTYTPTGGTGGIGSTVAGPAVGVTVGAGAHAIRKPDGNYLLIAGNAAQNTRIYNPGTKAFSAGNATGANVGAGAHSIERPGNLFLVLTGGATNVSSIYDATANTFAAGPTVLGLSSVGDGAHAYQRADGKWMIIKANASNATSIYDPVANTMAAGPTLVTTYATGAISLQKTDGKYLTLQPTGATAGSLYDAGYFVSGQYISEAISPSGINSWTTIQWDNTADVTLTIYVRTATTEGGLTAAAWRSIAASGGAISPGAGEVWLQARVDYSRAIPSYPLSFTEIWPGSSSTFYIRSFAQPDIQEIRLNYLFTPVPAPTPTPTPGPTPTPAPASAATLFETRYFYDSALKAVMREEKRDSVIVSVTQVAADILIQGQVTFTFDSAQRKMTVTITPTVQEAPAIGDISRAATLVAFLRPKVQPVAPTP